MTAARRVTVGLVQHACSKERDDNIERAIEGLREAKKQGAQLVCLPELFAGPYFCQVQDPAEFERAEALDGVTVSRIQAAAKELHLDVLVSVFERRSAGLCHNTLLHLSSAGSVQAVYRKTHIPQDPLFEEKFYFTPGDLGFVSSDTPQARIGLLVCWDQWFPEAARLTTMQGAEVLFYPTAIGWMEGEEADHQAQLSAWQTMQRSNAIANGVFVVAVNRVGVETTRAGNLTFWGHSFVCGPDGQVLAQAGTDEQVLVVSCALDHIDRTRRVWPFLRDRRIDLYGDLTKRWSAS
jgi:N-carbamoylputrescine amidase